MREVVIRAEGLGKSYRIGRQVNRYKTLRESLTGLVFSPVRKVAAIARGEPLRRKPETIWALRDLELEVRKGEVLGIIGRNGAGKSTLLKILARITEPTEGRVELRGRVGSLLEVGTGFHPELTGRENIYLNGAILGMRKAEIEQRFDEIVAFSEIGRFLDTPVKRYSSGMYVRLAFAVAAHMDPEVLLVDEVLAVGDATFQKKCLGKLGDVAGQGRTVLFVSHNMAAVRSLCPRSVLISAGRVAEVGDTAEIVRSYLADDRHTADGDAGSLLNHHGRLAGSRELLKRVTIRDAGGNATTELPGLPFMIDIEYELGPDDPDLSGIGFILIADDGARVGSFNTYMMSPPVDGLPRKAVARFHVDAPVLLAGWYSLTVSAGFHRNQVSDKVESAVRFRMGPVDPYGAGLVPNPSLGVVALSCRASLVDPSLDPEPGRSRSDAAVRP